MDMTPGRKGWSVGRGLLAATVTGATLGLVENLSLVPAYREITGFVPFDLQFPLSNFMIGVELGAFNKAAALDVYKVFAAVDVVYMAAVAAMFTLLWIWLFSLVPLRFFTFLKRGGILMIPTYVVVLDIVTKTGFFRLLQGLSGEDFTDTIEFCTIVHRLKYAVIDIRNYVTIAFVLVAVTYVILRRRARRDGEGSAFPS